ncbi:hypothetical protein L596_009386 [Steinernema carpocapsae]|uniref:Fukutin n=1 Tax=Steinernema carpocapsae TaxID=34508 RepID=A0A4U5PGI0_STECR|nr:hypothetical protein L596_009386 [Steinernema carpocapsae]
MRFAQKQRLLRLLFGFLLITSFCIVAIRTMFYSPEKVDHERSDVYLQLKEVSKEMEALSLSTSTQPVTTTTTETPTTQTLPEIPIHIKELFKAKQLNIVALDPAILDCVTKGRCMLLTASESTQIGTFLKDTGEVRKVFEEHFKGSEWKIQVLSSLTAVVTRHYWEGYDRKMMISVIQKNNEKQYWMVEENVKHEVEERAFDRFNTTMTHGIKIPANIPRFELWWKNGRFISCNENLAEAFAANSSIIKDDHIKNLKVFTDMLLDSNQIPTLAFGTRWYRNCGVIPYTTDIDVSVHISQYNETFKESIRENKDYRLLRFIGRKEHGLEFTAKIPGSPRNSRVDVFYLFPHNGTFDWASGTYPKGKDGWARIRTLVPKYYNQPLCTGDVFGHLFFVPCNFLDVIEKGYGKTDWQKPQESYSHMGPGKMTFWDGYWNVTLDNILDKFNFTYEDYQ